MNIIGCERSAPPRRSGQGSILVFTVWVIFILTIFAMTLAGIVSDRIFFAQGYRERAQAYIAACSGINQAIAEIKKDTQANNYDTLNELWCSNAELFNNQPIGSAFFSISFNWTDGGISYGMHDEESSININTASQKVLETLFKNRYDLLTPSEAESIANAIIDWRDEDSNERQGGAENNYYQSLSNPYPCKNKPFDFIEELLLVKGITDDIYDKVRDIITVYGDGRVNINTASGAVFMALGLSDELANKVIRYRNGPDETRQTEDDRSFVEMSSIVSVINQAIPLTSDESQALNNLVATNAIITKSNHFRIQIKGFTGAADDPKNSRTITCIIKRNGKILYWNE
ncbi:MAG: general secretion pathway protein GspK [Candidatus Brocadiia bacterium]